MVVDAGYEERYWYPDDGGQVWVAGYQLVDPESGRYLARDAPELAARGLHVVGVAGAGRHHAEAIESSDAVKPGSPLELRRDPDNEHDPNAIAVHAGGAQVGWVPRELAAELAPRARRGPRLVGARAPRAAPLAARPAPRPHDAAGAGRRDRAAGWPGDRRSQGLTPQGSSPQTLAVRPRTGSDPELAAAARRSLRRRSGRRCGPSPWPPRPRGPSAARSSRARRAGGG